MGFVKYAVDVDRVTPSHHLLGVVGAVVEVIAAVVVTGMICLENCLHLVWVKLLKRSSL